MAQEPESTVAPEAQNPGEISSVLVHFSKSTEDRDQHATDSTEEERYQSDTSDDMERYRLESKPDKPPRQGACQNSQHSAFMSWVADTNREPLQSTPSEKSDFQAPSEDQTSAAPPPKIIHSPRQYQLDLFERAKQQNTIVVLDTGLGKTLIAALLLEHTINIELERRTRGQAKKFAFFLVDKVALCIQQHRFLERNLEYPIGQIFGDSPGIKKQQIWEDQADQNMVIVCTAQILLDLLGSGIIRMSQINLLIFDEAHHTKKNHPYATIMREHYIQMKEDRPRILGMTASPVDAKTKDFQAVAFELEAALCSRIATISNEALSECLQKKQQVERVVHFAPLASLEDAATVLCRELSNLQLTNPNLRKHIDMAKDVASIIGPWAADQYWRLFLKNQRASLVMHDLVDEADVHISGEEEAYYELGSQLDDVTLLKIRKIVTAHFQREQASNFGRRDNDFSIKVQTLHEILCNEFAANESTRCIVFVQKRYIAYLLSETFRHSALRIPNVETDFLVGSQCPSSSIVAMSINAQTIALNRFMHGQTKCIFATQVAEEGIDVKDCDLIIRFDMYDSAIQYIQSRGRARHEKSTYISMVEEGNIQDHRRIMQAKRDMNALRVFCSSLPSDRKVENADEADNLAEQEAKKHIIFEVPETGARLTFTSSRQVLAKFVSSVCNSADAHPEYVTIPSGNKFITTILLPEACFVKTFIGTPQRNKNLARGSAAFKACIELLNRKYVNGHLQPTYQKVVHKMRNARLAISDKKRSEYNMRDKPSIFLGPFGTTTELFMATLVIEGLGPTGRRGRPIYILTRSALPATAPIHLYVDGDIRSLARQIQHRELLTVTENQIKSLANFTLTVFSDVFSKAYDNDQRNIPYFLAPSTKQRDNSFTNEVESQSSETAYAQPATIDWNLIETVGIGETPLSTIRTSPHNFEKRFVFDPWDGSRKFFTSMVNKGHRPFDPVPSDAPLPKSRSYLRVEQNIAEYSNSLTLQSRQRVTWNSEQPVFDAELLPLRRDLFREPQHEDVASSRSCCIILEPLTMSKIPIDIVVTALALPVIMHRIESTAIAMDACQLVDLLIEPPLALEALTQTDEGADTEDNQNYERLEFLGDSFLKMATTISLFTLLPDENEAGYHVQRMLMVCNQNLFNHALHRGIQEYVRSKSFDRRTWYPDLKLLKGKAAKPVNTHSLSDKAIADVCEALIGAAYMSQPEGVMDLAVKAVTKMVRSKYHKMERYSDYYGKHVTPDWQKATPTASERFAADIIEKRIGYRFNSPRLLRSAFKHPSYPFYPDIPNYQRPEFLGDALLDVAIVDFLFRRYPQADPQWLTEHKMAMASNHFYSCLCVELGLHRHLLTTNSSMMGHMAAFVESVDKAKARATAPGDKVPRPNFWLDVEHPPKALSDILEAVVGAMFEDSKYDYDAVRRFFSKFISPYFQDMSLYDTYTADHPVSKLTKLMQDTFCCRSWRLCVSAVPCGVEEGAAAVTNENVVCALMIHKRKAVHSVRASGKYAKVDVAMMALRQFGDLDKDKFRTMMGCDC